jgi:lipopolysaccharide transport system ATP-binding protein
MLDTVIQVERLSKKYILDHRQEDNSRYVALRDVVVDGAKSLVRRLQYPSKRQPISHREEFWALKDVSFDVHQGEVVGIIGRNGAGKSTLLKILSRITEPTAGSVKLRGRVASLLEVGTGFHPELTGRENIFLNGAILGMSRAEINRKFDEIVAFAEVSHFLDTPVKRYSSGMYVRLAFAVAAHLEPEILVVDEVLAVGDAAFQQKCLGKMKDVTKQDGKTILFVSHNMAAIRSLCHRVILLKEGQIYSDSIAEEGIAKYLSEDSTSDAIVSFEGKGSHQSKELTFEKAYILNSHGVITSTIDYREGFSIVIEYKVIESVWGLRIGFGLQNNEGLFLCGSNDPEGWKHYTREPGNYVSRCIFPGYILNRGIYMLNFGSDKYPYGKALAYTPFCLKLVIEDTEGHGETKSPLPGIIRPNLEWFVNSKEIE